MLEFNQEQIAARKGPLAVDIGPIYGPVYTDNMSAEYASVSSGLASSNYRDSLYSMAKMGNFRPRSNANLSIDSILSQAPYKTKTGNKEKISYALLCASADGDDLINSLMLLKTDLSVNGFAIQAVMDEVTLLRIVVDSIPGELQNSSGDLEIPRDGGEHSGIIPRELLNSVVSYKEANKALESFSKTHRLSDVVRDLFWDWYVTDNAILFWNVSNGTVNSICTISPDTIDYDNSTEEEFVYIDLPQDLIKIVHSMGNKRSDDGSIPEEVMRLLSNSKTYPAHWIRAAMDGEKRVRLDKAQGDNFSIRTRARKHCGTAIPSMCTIFPEIFMRSLLKDGMIGASFMMKHFIFHAKVGEPITSGDLAGHRHNYASPKDLDEINCKISSPEQAFRMATNHTVDFEYVYPPMEMWSRARFEHPDYVIHNWIGVNAVLSAGSGDSTSGYISNKRLVCHVEAARDMVKEMVCEMLSSEEVIRSLSLPDGDFEPNVVFNDQVLKEQRLVMQEANMLINAGLAEPFSTLREMDRDPVQIIMNKLCAIVLNSVTEIFSPTNAFVNRAYQGNNRDRGDAEQQQGRPPGDNVQPTELTRNQRGQNAS